MLKAYKFRLYPKSLGRLGTSEATKMLDKYKVDLIVTTSAFTNKDIPCIVVNPLLTQEDILLLRKHIKKCRAKKIDSMC
jgi:transcriptional antiterminator